VHPTGGSLRVFRQFAWLEVGSVKMVLSHPAHQRVTQAVRRTKSGSLGRNASKKPHTMHPYKYRCFLQSVLGASCAFSSKSKPNTARPLVWRKSCCIFIGSLLLRHTSFVLHGSLTGNIVHSPSARNGFGQSTFYRSSWSRWPCWVLVK
jgi:hypothetical protein